MTQFILKYWLECLFSTVLALIGAGLKYVIKKVKQEHEEQQNLKDGVLALLHDRLYQYAEHLLEKETLTAADMENLEYLYQSYAALGGNGTGELLYNACKKKFENQGVTA